jgi:hypothetical protein
VVSPDKMKLITGYGYERTNKYYYSVTYSRIGVINIFIILTFFQATELVNTGYITTKNVLFKYRYSLNVHNFKLTTVFVATRCKPGCSLEGPAASSK